MANSYLTTNTLIESVKRKESIPASQVTFEDADFIAFANEEIKIGLIPSILQFHEEFFVYAQEIPLVNNQDAYPVPDRAIGGKVRTVFWQDTSGNLAEVSRINPEDIAFYTNAEVNSRYFYVRNSSIVLVPSVTNAVGSLIVSYYMRPNELVDETRVAIITAIDRTTGVVTVNDVPTGFATSAPVDFIGAKGMHKTKAIDISPTAVEVFVANTITFDPDDLPSDLVDGDHIAFAGETIIPQIPDDLHVVLAQRVAARCLEALGDQAGLQAANTKLAEIEQRMGNVIDNRTEGNPQKVFNKNSFLSRFNFKFPRR